MRHHRLLGRVVIAAVTALVLPAAPAPALVAAGPAPAARATIGHVLVISVDGLNPTAITRDRTPAITRMIRRGASTRNARTEVESTSTLPNHTGMVTSRRVDADRGGHGVTWNDDRLEPRTVQEAAGHRVGSVFSVLQANDRSAALFSSKEKLLLFDRSWDRGVDRAVVREDNHLLTSLFLRDVVDRRRAFTFLHLSGPDRAGHRYGFLSSRYLAAVARADREVGRVLRMLGNHPTLASRTTVVLTADHGGKGASHTDPRRLANYRVPFVVWGAGTARGADLYRLNPDYANPGKRRVGYSATRPPVRNGEVANLALDLLGLSHVPGAGLDADQGLDVR